MCGGYTGTSIGSIAHTNTLRCRFDSNTYTHSKARGTDAAVFGSVGCARVSAAPRRKWTIHAAKPVRLWPRRRVYVYMCHVCVRVCRTAARGCSKAPNLYMAGNFLFNWIRITPANMPCLWACETRRLWVRNYVYLVARGVCTRALYYRAQTYVCISSKFLIVNHVGLEGEGRAGCYGKCAFGTRNYAKLLIRIDGVLIECGPHTVEKAFAIICKAIMVLLERFAMQINFDCKHKLQLNTWARIRNIHLQKQ